MKTNRGIIQGLALLALATFSTQLSNACAQGVRIIKRLPRLQKIACCGWAFFIMASAPAQNLLVDSYFNGTIIQITPSGVQSTFASGLTYPEGMAFDSAGNLFVAERLGSIVEIAPNGSQSTFTSGFSSPMSLTFDSKGDLFVDDFYNGTIDKIAPGGATTIFASGLYHPQGMAIDSHGDIFVTSVSNIYKITPDGTKSTFASGFRSLDGLVVDSADNVIAEDFFAETLDEFTSSGITSTIGTNLINVYNCVAVNRAGVAFAGEWGTGTGYNGDIIAISPNGTQSTFASGLYSPTQMVFAPIPEPTASALLSVGAVAFLACRRFCSAVFNCELLDKFSQTGRIKPMYSKRRLTLYSTCHLESCGARLGLDESSKKGRFRVGS